MVHMSSQGWIDFCFSDTVAAGELIADCRLVAVSSRLMRKVAIEHFY